MCTELSNDVLDMVDKERQNALVIVEIRRNEESHAMRPGLLCRRVSMQLVSMMKCSSENVQMLQRECRNNEKNQNQQQPPSSHLCEEEIQGTRGKSGITTIFFESSL
jgi:hypothetical protein